MTAEPLPLHAGRERRLEPDRSRLETSNGEGLMAAKKTTARNKAAVPPWKKAAPKGAKHRKLTPGQKAAAKRSAEKAGRPYPNLVDNMRAARSSRSD